MDLLYPHTFLLQCACLGSAESLSVPLWDISWTEQGTVSIWSVPYLFISKIKSLDPIWRKPPCVISTSAFGMFLLGQKSSHNWRRWGGSWWHHKSEEAQGCSFHAETPTEVRDADPCGVLCGERVGQSEDAHGWNGKSDHLWEQTALVSPTAGTPAPGKSLPINAADAGTPSLLCGGVPRSRRQANQTLSVGMYDVFLTWLIGSQKIVFTSALPKI